MKVVILCGGKGTRLHEETEYRPKPMVPIGQRPILWHIMKIYATFGYRDFVLCLGYKGELIKAFFRNYLWNTSDVTLRLGHCPEVTFHTHHAEEDWTVTLAETGEDSMTAYRIRAIQRYLPPDEPFFLTYGDGLARIDLTALLACHRASGRLLTLSAVRPAGRYGALNIETDGAIRTFQEKPPLEQSHVNGGFMVCEPGVFDHLGDDPSEMFEHRPLQTLAGSGQLHAYRHEGFWQPMDTYREWQILNEMWKSGNAPWKIW